jgi:hypothetical protein
MGKEMKIGVISDTHIPERAKSIPGKILEEFKGVDMIIHAGDFVNIEVLAMLKKACPDVRGVSGNMDLADVRKNFPEKEIITVGKFKIGVKHGYGPPDKLIQMMQEAFKKDDVDMVIFGHSHNALNLKEGKVLYFNPGSPTDNVFSEYNSFGIIEINDKIEARIVKL